MKLAFDRKYAPTNYASLLLWGAITLLFLYERTYLIQKAGLPHFIECTVVRVGLLMLVCYTHIHLLIPLFLPQKRYSSYGSMLILLAGFYLWLQGLYDSYLFGFVIGDQQRQDIWQHLPYNAMSTGWYLLLTYLIHDKTTTSRYVSTTSPVGEPGEPTFSDTTLVIKTGTQWVRLPLSAIRYVQGLKDYSVLHTQSEKYVVKGSIGNVTNGLPGDQFFRVHKSYVVGRQHIKSVSTTWVIMDGDKIPVGRAYTTAVTDYLTTV